MTHQDSNEHDATLLRQDLVDYVEIGRVAVVTINSPKTRNALSSGVLRGLLRSFEQAEENEMEAMILTGAGTLFSAGGDLASVAELLDGGHLERDLGEMVDDLHRVIIALRSLNMPTVAAINGPAIGAGISLAMATDVRVCGPSAFFMTGYLAVGASPDGGASYHLARALGESQALSALLLNRRFTAAELNGCGLVDEVAPEGSIRDAAMRLADRLAGLSFPAIRATRELVFSASAHSLEQHLDSERLHFLAVAQTAGFQESVAPFDRRSTAVPA